MEGEKPVIRRYKDDIGLVPFEEQVEILAKMLPMYHRLVREGYADPDGALLATFNRYHRSPHGVAIKASAEELRKLLAAGIRSAGVVVSTRLARQVLRRYRGQIDLVNEALGTDPHKLLKILAEGRIDQRHTSRVVGDVCLKLALGLQFTRLELVYSHEDVSTDLDAAMAVLTERLLRELARPYWVVAQLDARGDESRVLGAKPGSSMEPRIFVTPYKSVWREKCREWDAYPYPLYTDKRLCRVIEVNGLKYVVFVSPRPKNNFERIVKWERRGHLADSIGWLFIVMGILLDDGEIRRATVEDAVAFEKFTLEHLWMHPLVVRTDRSNGVNLMSDERYEDRKVRGYYLREERTRFMAGPCEQIVMTATQATSTLCSRSGDNHDAYEKSRLLPVAARWVNHIPDLDLTDPAEVEALKEQWRSELPAITDIRR